MIIGDILNAVLAEAQAYCDANPMDDGTKGFVIFKTDFKDMQQVTRANPLVVIDVPDAPESGQWLGGNTRMDFVIAINCYNYEPDAYLDDTTGYSGSLANFTDGVREHFSFGGLGGPWLTQSMIDIEDSYGFRLTLAGMMQADPLDQDGIVKGFKVVFDTIAVDTTTALITESIAKLTTVTQVNNPPFD